MQLIEAIDREERKSGQKLYRRDGNRAASWTRIKVPIAVKDCARRTIRFTLCAMAQEFAIDKYAVSNTQFAAFVKATKHKTDAEAFQWSFVLEALAPPSVVQEVDGPDGYG